MWFILGLEGKIPEENVPVHVINIDIQDNHEEATIGAFLICELGALLTQTEDLDNDIDELLHDFETKCSRNVLHCVQFYWDKNYIEKYSILYFSNFLRSNENFYEVLSYNFLWLNTNKLHKNTNKSYKFGTYKIYYNFKKISTKKNKCDSNQFICN